MARDLNLFYGNCDLDLGNIQAWKKFQPPSKVEGIREEKRVACVRGEKGKIETTDGKVNRPRCYASVNEYIRKRFLSRSAGRNSIRISVLIE